MNETQEKKKTKKCSIKCTTCAHYCKASDFCEQKLLEHCSKKPKTYFESCSDYLINEKLIMF